MKHLSLIKKSRRLVTLALCVSITFGVGSAFANKYIKDYNWSQMLCIEIPREVDRLNRLGDHFDDRADKARAEGSTAEAEVYQTVANEAHLEADEGEIHYQLGFCR